MAAPNASLLAALRDPFNSVARHLFFSLAHSQGTVYAWDGIGDYTLGGNTYTGVGNLASLNGISQTRELQTHGVEVTLQGVSFAAIRETDQDVRGDAAEIQVLWIDQDGTTYGPLTLFSGKGDNLRIEMDRSTCTLKLRLRGPMADWSRPPASYYTPGDQDREFSGDTGMQFVPDMENKSTSGWSLNEETSGGVPVLYKYFVGTTEDRDGLFGDLGLVPVGHNTDGLNVWDNSGTARPISSTTQRYEEDGTAVGASFITGNKLAISGVAAYIDTSGDVRSAGGALIEREDATGEELREQGAIASIGSAQASETISEEATTTVSAISSMTATRRAYATTAGAHRSGQDISAVIYCNKYGLGGGVVDTFPTNPMITLNTQKRAVADGARTYYAEHGTGNTVDFQSGLLKCNGANVTISTTGALRTSTGNYITYNGDADAFLRVWT